MHTWVIFQFSHMYVMYTCSGVLPPNQVECMFTVFPRDSPDKRGHVTFARYMNQCFQPHPD